MSKTIAVWRISFRHPTGKGRAMGPPVPVADIEDVPEQRGRALLEEALAAWPPFEQWRARAGATAQLVLSRHYIQDDAPLYPMYDWEQLSPPVKTITTVVDGQLWARATQCARRRGMSLREWSAEALSTAVLIDEEATS